MRDEDNLTEQRLPDSHDRRQHPEQWSDDLPLTESDEYPRLLQAILAHTSEGAVLVQPSTGRILYTTVSLDRKFGYEPNELIGQHVTVLNAPDTSKETFDRIVEAMDEKGAWQGEINNKKKDGSCFWTWIDIFTFEHSSYGPVWVSVRRDVTDARRTQELRKFVRKLKGDFNDLVETLPHGIQLTDASWTITFANSALHEMYEYDAGELIGASVLDFVPSDRRQEQVERLKTLVTQKPKPVPIFEQKVTRSGRVVDVRMDWGYRLDAKGRVLGFASLITDVTASMRVEAALRKTQEAFDLAVRGSSDGLWDWPDLTQDKRWWSPRIFELLGYEDGEIELTYAEFLGLMLSEDRERVARAMEAHLEEGVPYDVEHRLRTKSGEYRWFRGRGHALRTDDGRPTRMSGSVSDIHERQVARKELEERLAFQRMVSDVSTTFAKAPHAQLRGVIVRALECLGKFLDADRCVLMHMSEDDAVNAGDYEWTRGEQAPGLRAVRGEGLGAFSDVVTLLEDGGVHFFEHVEEIPSQWETFREFVEENHVKAGLIMPLLQGERLLGLMAAFTLRDAPNWPSVLMERDNIVGQLFANVLGNLEWEAGAGRLAEELTHVSRVATMGELTASLAHELNQPLEAIAANAVAVGYFLDGESANSDEARAALADISDEARRAGQVIRRMRALLEKGEQERSPLHMNGLVEEVVALLQNEAILRNTLFELDLDPELSLVEGDRIQLQQVLMNLLLNSIDATQGDSVSSRRVTIRTCNRGDEETEVVVLDEGVGLEPSIAETMFDPFFTTKPNGLGMGLSISRSIIEAHSGRLWAEQNPDGGAAFHFSIPNTGEGWAQRPVEESS